MTSDTIGVPNPVDSRTPVPPGHITSVITHLEMTRRPKRAALPDTILTMRKAANLSVTEYQNLFRLIGAPWLWFGRLCQSEESLATLLANPAMPLYIIEDRKREIAGMLELDFCQKGMCEIVYLGLVPSLNGKGLGKWLMAQCLMLAWAGQKDLPPIERIWLKTCTLDHPAALSFYRKQGLTPFAQEIEIYPDPRLTGHLPMDSAPQIPIFQP